MSVTSSPVTNGVAPSVNGVVKRGKRTLRRSKIPRLKKWTFVLVAWVDALTEPGQQNSEDDFPCPLRHSIGHFIKHQHGAFTIAMEDDRTANLGLSDCQTVTSLPVGMIRSVTVLVPKE